MLNSAQHQAFLKKGFFSIPAAIPSVQCEAMEQRIWDTLLEQNGIQYDAPDSWVPGQIVGLSHLRDDPVFQFQDNRAISQVLDAILGKDQWKKPLNWGQLLVSFPEQKEWTVPYDIWHTDFDFLPPPYKIQGLLVFSFVADVAERSGGTGVISGSHLLVRRFLERERGQDFGKMKAVRKRLYESDPWLKALTSKDESVNRIEYFMKAVHPSGDISLQVTELTGATGDVIIAHPWLLHATTTNTGLKPRIMCVHRIHRKASNNEVV